MEHCKIIAVGDNVCDKYLSRGKMYPGGQCVNTCVYVKMNNMESAYLGKYGDDGHYRGESYAAVWHRFRRLQAVCRLY